MPRTLKEIVKKAIREHYDSDWGTWDQDEFYGRVESAVETAYPNYDVGIYSIFQEERNPFYDFSDFLENVLTGIKGKKLHDYCTTIDDDELIAVVLTQKDAK